MLGEKSATSRFEANWGVESQLGESIWDMD